MTNNLIQDISKEQFKAIVLESSIPVLVDYWAVWCGPCKLVEPILKEVATEYTGRILVCRINVDDNADIAQKFGVRGIPTFMLFNSGQVVDTKVGAISKGQLCEFIDVNTK